MSKYETQTETEYVLTFVETDSSDGEREIQDMVFQTVDQARDYAEILSSSRGEFYSYSNFRLKRRTTVTEGLFISEDGKKL